MAYFCIYIIGQLAHEEAASLSYTILHTLLAAGPPPSLRPCTRSSTRPCFTHSSFLMGGDLTYPLILAIIPVLQSYRSGEPGGGPSEHDLQLHLPTFYSWLLALLAYLMSLTGPAVWLVGPVGIVCNFSFLAILVALLCYLICLRICEVPRRSHQKQRRGPGGMVSSSPLVTTLPSLHPYLADLPFFPHRSYNMMWRAL
eukprot:1160055-Pelagomonas_calceolata.AAC.1